LAFSVAAHLEPEILLVDEVLAVGDAAFQKKSLGKMGQVAREGRTILFVSHNMAAIESLCSRCLRFHDGHLVDEGKPADVTSRYLEAFQGPSSGAGLADRDDRVGSGEVRFQDVRLLDSEGREVNQVRMGSQLTIVAQFDVESPISNPVFGFLIADEMGRTVLRAYSHESHDGPLPALRRHGAVECCFEALPLMYGDYHVHLWISQNRYSVDYLEYAASLQVLRADVYGTGRPPDANNGGLCFGRHSWKVHH
jgi:lipopolysaccharide transport system ATP-binding protein